MTVQADIPAGSPLMAKIHALPAIARLLGFAAFTVLLLLVSGQIDGTAALPYSVKVVADAVAVGLFVAALLVAFGGRVTLIAVPYLWLLLLFLVPFLIVLKISLSDYAVSIPPYTPTLDLSEGWSGFKDFISKLDFQTFKFLTTDSLYWKSYLSSLEIAVISTAITLLIGYPVAYAMARAPEEWRATLMMLVILPFWTSFLIRVYAWMGILGREGLLNQLLLWLGVITEPLTILNTNLAVYIGIVYTYLPFMILPIYAALDRLDDSLLEAAEDLGCTRTKAFWLITIPLSRPGIIAGCFLVFIPALGEFVIPSLLGGSDTLMIGKVLWEEFSSNRDWPVASAVAVVLLLILIVPIVLFQKNQQRAAEAEK